MAWTALAIIATILFISGQTLLKKSELNPLETASVFLIAMGFIAFLGLVIMQFNGNINIAKGRKIKTIIPAILAGGVFYVGNVLLIKALKEADNIALVRILMAGIETMLLLVVALVIFGQKTTKTQILLTVIGLTALVAAALI